MFGIKPSWGRVPVYPGCRDERYPGISSWESLEHIGPITRTAADAALALSVLAGPTPRDRYSIPAEISDWTHPPGRNPAQGPHRLQPRPGFCAGRPAGAPGDARTPRGASSANSAAWSELAHPATGNPGAMFETLVALDTDRAGLRRMAEQQGVTLTGWLARLLGARLERR